MLCNCGHHPLHNAFMKKRTITLQVAPLCFSFDRPDIGDPEMGLSALPPTTSYHDLTQTLRRKHTSPPFLTTICFL